jgi:hypothetical protein
MTKKFSLLSFSTVLIVLSVLLLAFSPLSADDETCPRGQGFWKNTAQWGVVELVIGSQTYSQAELLILFNTPPAGDASLILAHQLIAAKLNVLNGYDATVAAGLITQADTFLSTQTGRLPYNIAPSSDAGQTMVNLGGVLESYNSGILTVGCDDDDDVTPTVTATLGTATPTATGTLSTATPTATGTPATATPTGTAITATATPTITGTPPTATPTTIGGLPITIVIEGPVQSININVITIYNIDIELAENDPNLTIIQIGDIVRIEGDTREDDDDNDGNITIIVVAVTVVIVNVDINIVTGDVWRDEGSDCANPPPPWAPANGWRRRCEGGGNNGNGNGNGRGRGRGNDDDDDDD